MYLKIVGGKFQHYSKEALEGYEPLMTQETGKKPVHKGYQQLFDVVRGNLVAVKQEEQKAGDKSWDIASIIIDGTGDFEGAIFIIQLPIEKQNGQFNDYLLNFLLASSVFDINDEIMLQPYSIQNEGSKYSNNGFVVSVLDDEGNMVKVEKEDRFTVTRNKKDQETGEFVTIEGDFPALVFKQVKKGKQIKTEVDATDLNEKLYDLLIGLEEASGDYKLPTTNAVKPIIGAKKRKGATPQTPEEPEYEEEYEEEEEFEEEEEVEDKPKKKTPLGSSKGKKTGIPTKGKGGKFTKKIISSEVDEDHDDLPF